MCPSGWGAGSKQLRPKDGQTLCRHLETDRPALGAPVYWTAWHPTQWLCGECFGRMIPASSSVENATCDGCGRISEIPLTGYDMYIPADASEASRRPSLYVIWALCDACDARNASTADAEY